jgi:starch-binding outer membrane protein, SusD/RagB family
MNHKIISTLFFTVLLSSVSCKRDYPNPNAPLESLVLSSKEGLVPMCNGLRARYSAGAAGALYSIVTSTGLSTSELRVVNAGNADLQGVAIGGGNLTNLNSVLTNTWSSLNVLNADCDKILASVGNIKNPADATLKNAVQAYAHLFKALAIGQLCMFWEQVAYQSTTTGVNATFESRASALDKAIKLCDDAVALLGTTPLPASFTNVVGTDLDLVNCLNALSARYNLMVGRYSAALTAANKVVLTSTSTFKFDNVFTNPLFRSSFTTNNVHDASSNMGLTGVLAPDPADGRLPFYLTTTGTGTPAAPRARGFFKADADPIPFYLPGEIILIKAEAYARLGTPADLVNAIAQINLIRQKTTDPLGVNANLPAYSGGITQNDLLLEIYRQRCVELYLTGLKLEDSRRFSRPGPGSGSPERTRNFYPYPFTERNNNPNTPADPAG